MSTPKAIVIQPAGAGFSITIPGEALRLKEQALAKGKPITQVTNGDEQAAAIAAAAVIKGLSSATGKTREEVKKPYLEAGRAIDAKAKEFVKELDAEAERLEKLIAAFRRAELEKVEAARLAAEQAQREATAAAAREQTRLAEIERQKEEAEKAAAEAKSPKARAAAEAEAARLEEERMEAEIDAMEAEDDAAAASATIVTVATPAATGASIRHGYEFEVTDIEAFYAFDLQRRKHIADKRGCSPFDIGAMVKLEVKRQDVKDFIAALSEDQLDSIPGLTITVSSKASVRGVAPSIALQ